MPSAYIIADVQVTDPQRYEAYKALSSLAIRAHGAEVLVRGGAVSVLEGDSQPGRLVVLKFPGVAAARAFYDSPEYLLARRAREGAALMRMLLVEGAESSPAADPLQKRAAARFVDADLSETVFNDVNLEWAVFENVALTGASFTDVDLANVTVDDARLDGMKINGVPVVELFAAYRREGRRPSPDQPGEE